MNKAKTTLDAIKLALGMELKLANMKLEDGVTVLEADSFEAGQAVNIKTEDDQLIALPEGEYVLEDGMVLIVKEEGMIDSIGEKVEEEEPVVEEEVAASDAPSEKAVPKKIIEAVTKESHFSSDIPEVVLEAIAQVVDAKFEEFKAELSKVEEIEEEVETIVHNPENVNMSSTPKGGLMSFLNNRK
jgi:hypothetical protein